MAITAMKIRPVMSMPVMTFFPSVAASSTASHAIAASTSSTLTQPLGVSAERRIDCLITGIGARESLERAGIVVEPQGGPRVVQLAEAEPRCSGRPDRAVAGNLFGAQIRTEGYQLGEVVDGRDRAALLDPDETVRVQVVPEQQCRVAVLRREQARSAVVQQVTLVDRLDPERIASFTER
jgi:hypothetical protein